MNHSAQMVLVFAALMAFVLAGCGSPSDEPEASTTPAASEEQTAHDHSEHEHDADDGQSAMEKMKAELAKLSAEDAASAEKQHFCPVSGEMLGTMGPPKKVDVNGQQVWICCDGCKDSLLENPDEYLAKLTTQQ